MEEKKEDLRIRRTHKLLCDAMMSLLEEKSFEDISVVEICDRAMVHRATFYKHFDDKYAFMEYVTKEKIREFYEKSTVHKHFDSPVEIYKELVANIMQLVDDNKKMLEVSISSSDNTFFAYLEKIIANEILEFLNYLESNGSKLSVPADVTAYFLTGGFCTLVRWWLTNEDKYTQEEMTSYLMSMLTKNDNYS